MEDRGSHLAGNPIAENRTSRRSASPATVSGGGRRLRIAALFGFSAMLFVAWPPPAEGYLARGGASGAPQFHYLTANLPSTDPAESRVTVYVAVANRELRFRRMNGTFQAAYTVSIVAQQGKQEIGTHWRRRVTVMDYPATTTSNEFDFSEGTLMLKPGRYRFLIKLEDEETHKVGQAIRDGTVRDFSRGLKVSDVIFLERGSMDSIGVGNIVFPELGPSGGEGGDLHAYFEVCAQDSGTVDIQWDVLGAREKVVVKDGYRRSIRMNPSAEIVQVSGGTLPPGRYLFRVRVQAGKQRDRSMRLFYIRHTGQIRPKEDLDLAVEQLRYVASPTEWHRMMNASEEEKRALFEDFWKQRDPTPDTPDNELMDEYYTRVAYANQQFSIGRAGWRTDRGAVYIIYGPPDSVQRRALWDNLGQERSYEIWEYKEVARKFVFLYDPLLGDFRLVSGQ